MSVGQDACKENSSDSDTEWIEVEDSTNYAPPPSSEDLATSATSEPLEITLQPQISRRKRSIVERYLKMHERSQRIRLQNTHLLCLLARAQLISKRCSDQELQAALLSLMPSQLACMRIEVHQVRTHIEQVLWWYKSEFKNFRGELDKELAENLEKLKLSELHMFVCLLTALGYRTRLVQNLIVQGIEEQKSSNKKRPQKQNGTKNLSPASSTSTCNEKSPYFISKPRNRSDAQISRQSNRLKRLKVDYTIKSEPEQTADSEDEFQTPKKRKKSNKRNRSKTTTAAFENVRTKSEEAKNTSIKNQVVSPRPSEEASPSNEWLEVRLEEGWKPLHYELGVLTAPDRCAHLASAGSLVYVIGTEVDGKASDVTARYSLQWGGRHAKLRLDNEAWHSILSLCSAPVSDEDEIESRELDGVQLSLPLPPKLSDYKSNPYYALERHLLKFQAIHPEDSPPAGSFRGEKIYFRSNVAELHTRENWLKEGRVIVRGQSAYKNVKGRTKPGAEGEGERMIELFGKWQTEIYIPPPVVDGKIPKNEFGNVEMFQPFMLPAGAAHVDLPGIAFISRKLGIDYALAMVGWEFHGIACHPVFRGIVVAKENEQLIREAWREGEEARKEKERIVKEKKVFERWRKIIRAALIKDRVREKFNISESEMEIDQL